MRADVPDEAGHFYDTCRQLMPFVEPERMVGIVYMGYVPDKQMLCMIYIYRTDNGGLFVAVAKDQSFRCTEEDMNYFTAICINEYGIDPRSVKDVDEFLSYIYTNYPEEMKKEMRKTVTEGMVYEEEPVEEELGMAVAAGLVTASVVATGATIMGVMVAAVTLVKKDKLELKIAIDAYESSKHPKIKFSSLSAKQYELDRVDRPTNKELSGISKFFNKYSRRAEVWRSSSGEIVCSNVQYSDYYPGAYSDTTITHYLYDVNPKYKKDAAYLCASMCLADCISNKVSLTFVEDMKKEYPDKFKDIKLKDIRKTKIFGKSLESVECESTPENYKATLESMIAQKQRRSLRNSMGGTLFESFMIANSNSIRDEAIMEGMDVDTESTMNAALIETILQYTVLETLNTTKLYNFTSADVAKIKAHNRSTLRN